MAKITTIGMDEASAAFQKAATMPAGTKVQMMQAYADVALDKVQSRAGSDLAGPYNRGLIKGAAITKNVSASANGASADITFEGTRKNGKTSTRIAEIAFVNEYGRSGKGAMKARPFIKNALHDAEAPAAEAAEQVLDAYLASLGF